MSDDALLTTQEVCERFGWTLEQFRKARELGFPPCVWETTVRHRERRMMPTWPLGRVNRWAASVRALQLGTRARSRRPAAGRVIEGA